MRGLSIVAITVLTGCATFTPGAGVSPRVSQNWGCDHAAVQAEIAVAKEGLGMMEEWIPQVGWDACKLLARNGIPTRVEYQQSTYGRSASWWYDNGSTLHLVTLELVAGRVMGARWVVSYVGW